MEPAAYVVSFRSRWYICSIVPRAQLLYVFATYGRTPGTLPISWDLTRPSIFRLLGRRLAHVGEIAQGRLHFHLTLSSLLLFFLLSLLSFLNLFSLLCLLLSHQRHPWAQALRFAKSTCGDVDDRQLTG